MLVQETSNLTTFCIGQISRVRLFIFFKRKKFGKSVTGYAGEYAELLLSQ